MVEKPQGEEKAVKIGSRGWQSGVGSANYIDLRNIGERPLLSPHSLRKAPLLAKNARNGAPRVVADDWRSRHSSSESLWMGGLLRQLPLHKGIVGELAV